MVLVTHAIFYKYQWDAQSEQSKAAQAQLVIAQKQFETADRPWLSVDAASERPLLFRSLGAGITVKFTVKNVGRSVANNAVVIADAFIGKSGEDVYGKAIKRQKQICEENTTTITSHAVFPGDTFTEGQLIIAEIPAMEREDVPFFLIIGCVTYRFGDQPTRHHTYFIYDIVGPKGHPVQIGQDIPAGGLTFFKSPDGGDAD
jgi:hypothetical protein